jgi:hypothetical protein
MRVINIFGVCLVVGAILWVAGTAGAYEQDLITSTQFWVRGGLGFLVGFIGYGLGVLEY